MGIGDRWSEVTDKVSEYTGKIKHLTDAENLEFIRQLTKNLVSPDRLSPFWQLKLFSLTQVPLLFLTQPKVLKLDDETCEIRMNLNFITKNHLNSVYFGAQAIGADSVVGLPALFFARKFEGKTVVPVFKSFKADFLKRAEGDLLFVCNSGAQINAMVEKACTTGERVTEEVAAEAQLVESGEVVSQFVLGLSLKCKS